MLWTLGHCGTTDAVEFGTLWDHRYCDFGTLWKKGHCVTIATGELRAALIHRLRGARDALETCQL